MRVRESVCVCERERDTEREREREIQRQRRGLEGEIIKVLEREDVSEQVAAKETWKEIATPGHLSEFHTQHFL